MEKVPKKVIPRETVQDSSVSFKKVREKFQEPCETLLQLPERKNSKKKVQGLSLAVKNLYHVENKVYVQFEIENYSGVRFDFGQLELFKISGKKGRNASHQEQELLPLYRHKVPKKVIHGQTTRFVYVYPKFHLDKGEKLRVNLSEDSTSRIVILTFK